MRERLVSVHRGSEQKGVLVAYFLRCSSVCPSSPDNPLSVEHR